jgi:carbon-monoxide dehydrogenase medium subunit
MATWTHYLTPSSLQDALRVLNDTLGSSCIIAGGTDLLLELQQGRHPPVDTLVDVSGIPEMQPVEMRQGELFIGAAAPLSRVSTSPLVAQHAQALIESAGLVGGPQVRNAATLGGNVAHALPAADGAISLIALEAQAEIASLDGNRRMPIINLYRGPGESTLDPQKDILVGFYIPVAKDGQASAFSRIMRPQGVALPILNMAIWLERHDQQIADIHIAVGPSGPTPGRPVAAEEFLKGKNFIPENLEKALPILLENIRLRTSAYRATADYRKQLCGVLLKEVFEKAWQRAGETSPASFFSTVKP